MRNLLLVAICLLYVNNYCFSTKFEISPILLDFNSIEVQNDIFFINADNGSAYISYDSAITWNQVLSFMNAGPGVLVINSIT